MGEASIVTLLVEKADFFKESIQNRAFGLRLALKMKYFSKNDSSGNIKNKVKMLLEMWLACNDDFLKYRNISVRVIAEFLKLFGLDDHFGSKGKAAVYAKEWLEEFHTTIEANFLIKSWLDAGGEKEIVKEYIPPWLKKFPLEFETRFVIKPWLDAGGEKEIVKDYIPPWLKKFPEVVETSFLIKSWLDAQGDRELVKNCIKPWLGKFPFEEEDTSFVLRAWLNAGGERQEVETFVAQWLEKFHNSFEASFVIKAWLKNTKDHDYIKTYALQWLRTFKDHPAADFVIKGFCISRDISDDVLDAAVHWCKKYEIDSEALFTLSYLTRYHINNKKIAGAWLLGTLSNWTNRDKLNQDDRKNLENIMFNISANKGFCFSGESIELSIKWFLSAHSFQPITLHLLFLQRWWYFERYSRLLIDKRIDAATHEDKVKKFLHWVNGWLPQNKKQLKQNLKKLYNDLPQYNHFWEIVQLD